MIATRQPGVDGPGLSEGEAQRRALAGLANTLPDQRGRSVRDIVRSNVVTRFNVLLGSLLVVTLIVGPLQDAVFGLILVANTLLAIVQELLAKRTLDRLAILTARTATVVRDGASRTLPLAEIVVGDHLLVAAGDQVAVDATVLSAEGLEVDESLLSGESAPVRKSPGDALLGGSYVNVGSGRCEVTRVGEQTYARRVTAEARRFQLVRSELMGGINQILRVVTWIIVPTAVALIVSQLRANPNLADAVRGSVAGVITLVPEGLVLLTTASLALAVVRLGRRHVLVQQLAAVEMLARADVVCIDKTGTLTRSEQSVERVERLAAGVEPDAILAALARADRAPNATMRALAARFPTAPGWAVEQAVPFAAARRWSAVRFAGGGWWVLGAPEVILDRAADPALSARVEAATASGERLVVLASAAAVDLERGPEGIAPAALVALVEQVKPDAAATVEQLASEGVAIKVISGDHPRTVAAVAARAGLRTAGTPVDGTGLPDAEPELARVAEATTLFGRVSPEQKRRLVRALQSRGHTVAMVGDGVNDVLALKAADLGIAMATGAGAARAVAAVVLVDGSFAAMPAVVAEGRRVIGNVERLANLYFTKTVYAFTIAVGVGILVLPFPFLARQLTLVSALTIGIPSVYLTLAQGFERARGRFTRRVLAFAVPAGLVAGAATFAAYALTVYEPEVSPSEERTIATLVVTAIGLWILAHLVRPVTRGRAVLLALMSVGLAAALTVPAARVLFDLVLPRPLIWLAAIGVIALAFGVLTAGDRLATRLGVESGPPRAAVRSGSRRPA